MIDFKEYSIKFEQRNEPLEFGTPVSEAEIEAVEKI